MIEWKFYIDDSIIEEPLNFSDITFVVKRDEKTHGVVFEASLTGLDFIGAARDYIVAREQAEGLKAVMIFKAESRCSDYGEFEIIYNGKLNLGKLRDRCGKLCIVSVPVEQEDCTMLIKNRFDQKVDLDSLIGFDKITALQAYERAGFFMTIPAKALEVSAEGTVVPEGDNVVISSFVGGGIFEETFIRASYGNKINEAIKTTQLEPEVQVAAVSAFAPGIISPIVLLQETIDCFDGSFHYEGRMVGSLNLSAVNYMKIIIAKGTPAFDPQPLPTGLPDEVKPGMEILQEFPFEVLTDPYITTYDVTFTGDTLLNDGEGIWIYFILHQIVRADEAIDFINFDPETFITITASMLCPVTADTRVYLINEALSRVTEAITDGCVKVKSDLYGRTDSQPYASAEDGCGSLRVLNSGLQLRKAVDAKFFLSLKDAFDGLNPLDNIGFGLEDDPAREGFQVLRIEGVEYFYREEEIMSCPAIPELTIETDEGGFYSTVKVGYNKWEIESIKGLDEVNSNKIFRTSLNSVKNELDIQSTFVGGSYPIEITRQQSFAETGGADTKYDNDTFILCVARAAYNFYVEQGNILNGAGMYSPDTVLNWRIRPLYNLMRWFKVLGSSYANLASTENRFFFTSGTGNLVAEGEMISTFCKLENKVLAENDDLDFTDFLMGDDYTPLWRPKSLSFIYPLSVGEYKKIKDTPYGYISVQCGTSWYKGYINSVQYRPAKGEATFNLKMKW